MNNELSVIPDLLINGIGDKCSETKFSYELIPNFYFENLTDRQFFDMCGLKNSFVDFYSNIAKNGVKTIIFGGFYIGLKGVNKQYNPHISENANSVKILKNTIKNIHRFSSNAIIKIIPAYGREINFNKTLNVIKRTASFGYDIDDSRLLTFPISDSMISSIKEELIKLSCLAETIRADGVMIDATLSNIFGELISLEFNRRRFGYHQAGSNILFEIIKQIKKKCKFIKIYVKLSLFSCIYQTFCDKNNIKTLSKIKKIKNNKIIFNILDDLILAGCDGFEFEFGLYENDYLRDFNRFVQPDIFDEIYIRIINFIKEKYKENNIQIFYNNITVSTNKIINNNCYFNITKQYYSDNKFINKIKYSLSYRKCIKCSWCNELANKEGSVSCTVNPELYNNSLIVSDKKHVAIVGSGVSGLDCAITLAHRGFIVDLYEMNNILNKTGLICEIFNFDRTLKNFHDHLNEQVKMFVEESRINLLLNKKATVEMLNKTKYYAIIVATGFKQKNFCANGAIQNHVKSLYDILEHKEFLKGKKDIVIYAKTDLSFKFALYLLKSNYHVSIIVNNQNLTKFIHSDLTYYLFVFQKMKLNLYLDGKIKVINDDNVELIINKNYPKDYVSTIYNVLSKQDYKYIPQHQSIDCDLFVYEPETIPNNKLYYDLVKAGYKGQVYLIGQALEQGNLANDIESGYFVGKNL